MIEQITYVIKKIVYRNRENAYTIAKAELINKQQITVKGHFLAIMEGDSFTSTGIYKKDYFEAHKNNLLVPTSLKAIEEFLIRFVDGLGANTAKKIINFYGEDSINKIKETPNNLALIPGIGQKRAKAIHDSIGKHDNFEKIAMFILQNNGTYNYVIKIYESIGERAVEKINENPYILCEIGIPFKFSDNIAKNLNFSSNNTNRLEAIILDKLKDASRNGCMGNYLDFPEINRYYKNISAFSEALDKNDTDKTIKEMLKKGIIDAEYNWDKYLFYYLPFNKYVEKYTASIVAELIKAEKMKYDIQFLNYYIKKFEFENKIELNEKQKEAIYMAINNSISILTGGPGTGKTQSINALIFTIFNINKNAKVVLCAPTGKAARRMTELTGMEAITIHRYVNLAENEDIETPEFLIVDESSMIDAYLFLQLLKNINTDKTKILLVGDPDQLPSVEAGNVLQELLYTKIQKNELTEIFRQAKESQIVMNSHFIIKNKNEKITYNVPGKDDFYFIEKAEDDTIQSYLLQSIKNLIVNKNKNLDDIQVLCPTKGGAVGTIILNNKIQAMFNPNSLNKKEICINPNLTFKVGDRVMHTKNNYDLDVFNGEVGIIADIITNGLDYNIVVKFSDKDVLYTALEAEEVQLAYAITIHKSQGSEFPIVIMPISPNNDFINPSLIYTAWTRAKETVVCIGSRDKLKPAQNKAYMYIDSLLSHFIEENLYYNF